MTTNAAQYAAGGAEDDWFFTPALGLRAGQTYRLSFQYRGGGQPLYPDKLAVWLGDAPDPARQTSMLFRDPFVTSFPYLPNATTTPAVRDITVPADRFYYLGFQAYSQWAAGIPGNIGNGSFLLLDDVRVDEIGPTSARATAPGPALSLYPNSAAGRFTLALDGAASAGPSAVCVTDAQGRVVYRGTACANTRTALDLSGHPAGVYAVQVCGSAGCTTRRLLLE